MSPSYPGKPGGFSCQFCERTIVGWKGVAKVLRGVQDFAERHAERGGCGFRENLPTPTKPPSWAASSASAVGPSPSWGGVASGKVGLEAGKLEARERSGASTGAPGSPPSLKSARMGRRWRRCLPACPAHAEACMSRPSSKRQAARHTASIRHSGGRSKKAASRRHRSMRLSASAPNSFRPPKC